jgi:ABC-type taurine transport system substrate-binding protein
MFIVCAAGVTWKLIFAPKIKQKEEAKQAQERHKILVNTSSEAKYKHKVTITADSFSGYYVLRSEAFRNEASSRSIKIFDRDDQADYSKRIRALQSGETDFAVFTIGSLIKASALLGDMPAVIVLLIDRSYGADSAVASKNFASLDAFNDPSARIVLTPDSPSEELMRVIRQTFHLDRLSDNSYIHVNGMYELLAKFRTSKPNEKLLFVGWEPTMSQLVQSGQYKRIIDSSKVDGKIFDVLVVSRDFLAKNEEVVRDVVEAYFRANYTLRPSLKESVLADAQSTGTKLSPEGLQAVVSGIRWLNTQENYAHFGISSRAGYSLIEDMLSDTIKSLVDSGTIEKDFTGGSPNLLYYDKVVRSLFDNNFHPGVDAEDVRKEAELRALTDEEWKALSPVGTLQVPPLVFARGRADLIGGSEETLADLVAKLKTWPNFYLTVRGHTAGDNTPENLALQKARADAAVNWLKEHGVSPNRVKSEASQSNGSTTVKFSLGQLPY